MKSILKKLCKAALALSLAFTGVLFTTNDARAAENEASLYGAVTPKTFTYLVSKPNTPSVSITLNMYIDATGMMSLASSSIAPGVDGNAVRKISAYSGGYSQTGSNERLIVTFIYEVQKDNGGWVRVTYYFEFMNNKLYTKYYA